MGGFERVWIPRRLKAELVEKARAMRKAPTRSEAIFWERVRSRQVLGAKFRRQAPVAQFIVDFFCAEQRLVIEIDGPIHEHEREYDAWRQRYLEALGMRVLRFTRDEVEQNLEAVLRQIRSHLTQAPLSAQSERGWG